MVTGTAGSGVSNLISPTCQGRGQETVYVVQVTEPVTMIASTDSATTNFNTVLYVREAQSATAPVQRVAPRRANSSQSCRGLS